jgi:hypothetical protein
MILEPLVILEIETLNLGDDTRAIGMELVHPGPEREPVIGREAAEVWSRALPAIAPDEPLELDFSNPSANLREFCSARRIGRETAGANLSVTSPSREILAELIERFEGEGFGIRAGNLAAKLDKALEKDFAQRGVDAYQEAHHHYTFCAICAFDEATVTLVAPRLWATEVVRRVAPALTGMDVQVHQPV